MRRTILLAAAMAFAGAALPAAASADSPFPTYRQAAADQYGSPSQPSPPVGGQGGQGHRPGNPGNGGQGHPPRHPAGSQVAGNSGRGAVRVSPSTESRALPRGALPFTGTDLTLPVLIALALLSAGALCAAAARATRRRRAS